MKFRKLAKQISKIAIQYLLVATITLFLFEGAFRLYLIDFYKSSFEYLNSDFADRNTDKTLMIIGDSFSSFKEGYPKVLHDSLTEFRIRNISVPGTSVREQ
ncbi:MAG: flagellar biosynthesis protein FliR, partial [Roseivirga sp.]